jgi:creatinine amidohydrolase
MNLTRGNSLIGCRNESQEKTMEALAMKVRLDEMAWPEVKELLTQPHAVILPLGSTEEHGAHMPLNVDSYAVTYLAESAARKVEEEHGIRVVVAPTIDYTDVSPHKMFPGTIGVKVETLIRVIADIVEAFLDQEFKHVIALNGHLENTCSIEAALRIVADRRPGANIFAFTSVHGLGSEARKGLTKAGTKGKGHALEGETSCALLIQPQNVHLDKAMIGSRRLPLPEKYIGDTGEDRTKGVIYCPGHMGFNESGTAGDPTMASKEEGEKIFAASIRDLAELIVHIAKK